MKKTFTIGLFLCFTAVAASAQNKVEITQKNVVKEKAQVNVAASQKLSTEQVQAIQQRAASAKRADQLRTQEQLNAEIKEKRNSVKVSGTTRKTSDQ